jgi:hypothetical protein
LGDSCIDAGYSGPGLRWKPKSLCFGISSTYCGASPPSRWLSALSIAWYLPVYIGWLLAYWTRYKFASRRQWPPRGAPDRGRRSAPMDGPFGAWPSDELRRDRPSGRKGGAAYPAAGAARLPLAQDCVGAARRHRAGRPHCDGASASAAVFLGRAGAAGRTLGIISDLRLIRRSLALIIRSLRRLNALLRRAI